MLARRLAREDQAARIVEKTPNNVFFFAELHRLFPESPLVHVLRDGRDVVASLLEKDWRTPDGRRMAINHDPAAAAAYWVGAVTAARTAARDLPPGRYHEMRYEDLVTRTAETARHLVRAVGEPWAEEMLAFHEDRADVYTWTQRPFSAASVDRWREALDAEAREAVRRTAGPLLVELGYATDYDW